MPPGPAVWQNACVKEYERVAHVAAARAGALLRARYREHHVVTFKSEVDLVTAADRDAERLIVDAIRAAFPEHGIIAEESPPADEYSQYVVKGLNGWIAGWKKAGWRKADKGPVLNLELWQALDAQAQRHRVEAVWVRGHAGHAENERVDELAREAAIQQKARD